MSSLPPISATPGLVSDGLFAQQMEVDMVADLFKKLSDTCWTKCIGSSSQFTGGAMERREGACNDRCVAKWFAASEMIGNKLKEGNERGPGI